MATRHGLRWYDSGRFFCVTGDHVAGTPTTIEERTTELAAVYQQFFDSSKEESPPPRDASPNDLDDDVLIEKARAAKNGAKFEALWQGDDHGYGSTSEADLALCNLLAFWTGADAARIDALFRRSGRMRPKWDSRRKGSTYGADTVAKAVAECSETYTPHAAAPAAGAPGSSTTEIRRPSRPPFPEPDPAMFTGLLGDLTAELDPFTEASRVGVAAQTIVAVGSLVGRQGEAARVRVDGIKPQHLNIFLLVIGETGESRKQTAWAIPRLLCTGVDPRWRTSSGVISGEGVVWDLRDPTSNIRGKRIEVDEGFEDKRLLYVEEEFNRVLTVGRRENCTLFETLRECWDQDVVRTRGSIIPPWPRGRISASSAISSRCCSSDG